ncbi:MAG: PAS domain-containing protein [bacterium]|nr:PAS domain-containing protein [bacterium]
MIGGLVLIGWVFDISVLKSVFPNLVTMKANTAVAFVLSGISLWLCIPDRKQNSLRRTISQLGAGIVFLIGFLTLSEYLFRFNLGIDQLLFKESVTAVGTSHPGRMAPTTALNFFLTGIALLFLDTNRGIRVAQWLALTLGFIGFINFMGYVYGVKTLYGIAAYTQMAVHTAIVFLILSCGILAARADRGIMQIFASENMGSLMLRRLLPVAISVPFVLGWLRLWGQQVGHYGLEFGVILTVLPSILIIAGLMCWQASSLNRIDIDIARKRVEEAIRKSERNLAEAQRVTGIGSFEYDLTTDTAVWSENMYRILDVDPKEPHTLSLKHSVERVIHPDDQTRVIQAVKTALSGEKPYDIEYRIRRRDGTERIIHAKAEIIWNEAKLPIQMLGTVQDITERKEIERHLAQQLKRMSALRDIDMAITASLDLRVTMNVFLDQLTTQLEIDAATILLLDHHSQTFQFMVSRGFRNPAVLHHTKLQFGEGYAGRAAVDRKVFHIQDLKQHPEGFIQANHFLQEEFATYFAVPLLAKGQVKAVLELFERTPFTPSQEWLDFLEALTGQVSIAIDNAELFDSLQHANLDLRLAYDATIEGWSHALDLRDKETEGHTLRVTEITEKLGQKIGLPNSELIHLRRGALLHDIGKMGVPDSILLKPGALSEAEWVIMKKHPLYAYELLYPTTYLRPAVDIPFCHHEKWDGTGYPRGLKGDQIPIAARLFAPIDVWDALRSDRPYRPAWQEEKVIAYLQEQAGKHFEKHIVDQFILLLQELAE